MKKYFLVAFLYDIENWYITNEEGEYMLPLTSPNLFISGSIGDALPLAVIDLSLWTMRLKSGETYTLGGMLPDYRQFLYELFDNNEEE